LGSAINVTTPTFDKKNSPTPTNLDASLSPPFSSYDLVLEDQEVPTNTNRVRPIIYGQHSLFIQAFPLRFSLFLVTSQTLLPSIDQALLALLVDCIVL